jgi:hypothetical protein
MISLVTCSIYVLSLDTGAVGTNVDPKVSVVIKGRSQGGAYTSIVVQMELIYVRKVLTETRGSN